MTEKVWYRSSEGSTIQDRGTLTVGEGRIEFAGKKGKVSGRIRSAKKRPMGFKNWIHVSYEAADTGEAHDAYFLVSGMLGWGGVLGGNGKLTEALQAEAPRP
ncbi:MAG TPA: hypothetical protein VG518_07255 [Solirubrobacterales bacterium]|nr:hypothetical protein [Solirubrobacterales bacterium]